MSTKTPQYVAVRKNLSTLTGNLDNGTAYGDLRTKFIEEPWIGPKAYSKPDPDGLIGVALDRIKNNVKNYELFINMLQDIPEMDESVTKILGKLQLHVSSII